MDNNIEELREVFYQDEKIQFTLVRKNVKNINLRIKPDGKISVSANKFVPGNVIDDFIISKGSYILNAIQKYAELQKYAPKPKEYISGESFKMLSRDLRLKVICGEKEFIEADGVFLYLYVKDKSNFNRKKLLVEKWINQQCKLTFDEISRQVYGKLQKYGVSYPEIRIRNMTSRWGSCQTKKGIITLNKRLIEAPRNCVEYVVLHEYCHFIHPNHSKKFYGFVQMLMPDWRERKKVLESREYFLYNDATE